MAKDKKISSLDRVIQVAMGSDRPVGATDDPLRESHPNLWEWLSTTTVGTGFLKQPASLTVQLGPEGVLIRITDRDLAVSVDVGCRHLGDTFNALEAVLGNPTIPVRSWGKKEPKLRKRQN